MGLKNIKRNDIQSPLMGRFQIHRAGLSSVDGEQPCAGAYTP